MRKTLLFASLTALGVVSTGAHAQIKAEHPRFCVTSVGPTQMMFSAFQENKTDEIFCQHVPGAGPTMIILDARQPELRDMKIEVRVLRDVGQKDWRDDLDANTVAILPAGKHLEKKGTASFTYDFAAEGNYITLVRATSDDGSKEYVGQYQFSVGESTEWAMAGGALVAVAAIAALGVWRRGNATRKSPQPTARPEGSQAKPETSPVRQST